MNRSQWVSIIQTVVMMLAAAGVALLHRGFRTGKWARAIGEERDKELEQIHKRLDQAGKKTSELASDVQGIPARMHKEFVPREVFDMEKVMNAERREELRQEFRREDTKIWDHLRHQREIRNRQEDR